MLGGTQLGRLAGSWPGDSTALNPAREEAQMGVESKVSMYMGAGRPQEMSGSGASMGVTLASLHPSPGPACSGLPMMRS